MYLSKNIKALRKRDRLTQKDLGERLGVGHSVITSYESGRINPKMENLITLSKVFSVTIDDLLWKDLSAYSYDDIPSSTSEPKTTYGHGLEDPVVQNLISQQQQQIMGLMGLLQEILRQHPDMNEKTMEAIQQLLGRYPDFRKFFEESAED